MVLVHVILALYLGCVDAESVRRNSDWGDACLCGRRREQNEHSGILWHVGGRRDYEQHTSLPWHFHWFVSAVWMLGCHGLDLHLACEALIWYRFFVCTVNQFDDSGSFLHHFQFSVTIQALIFLTQWDPAALVFICCSA